MRKFLESTLTIMMVTIMSLGVISCSKNDDSSSVEGASIVGTWRLDFEDHNDVGYELFKFEKDGTVRWEFWYYENGDYYLDEVESFRYQYNAGQKELTFIFVDYDDKYESGKYTVYCDVTATKMIIYDPDEKWFDSGQYVYYRQ